MRARSASRSKLPRMTMGQGSASWARARQRSGPMPAGSPAVTAMVIVGGAPASPGRSELVLDVRLVAQAAQPQLGFLVGLGLAQRLEGFLADHVLRVVELAAA